eukprot:Skav231229  [mRNA]  locus=scaffold813:231514:232195:- [translate_table: standard]
MIYPQHSDGQPDLIQLILQRPGVVLQQRLRVNTGEMLQVTGVQIRNVMIVADDGKLSKLIPSPQLDGRCRSGCRSRHFRCQGEGGQASELPC